MTAGNGSKVLLLEFDLFRNLGGGQTSYRRLVQSCPWNTYYYFIEQEAPDAPRPSNAIAIPFKSLYRGNTSSLTGDLDHFYGDYLFCWQMANSIVAALGPVSFDVVDSPDYRTYAPFVRGVFAEHEIVIGVVALALHGTISSAVADLWPNTKESSRVRAQLRRREHLQFRAADVRYAISTSYAAEWQRATSLPSRILDPLHIVGPWAPVEAAGDSVPDVLMVGRRERRKGPDIALDLFWAAGLNSGSKLRFIGSDSPSPSGHGADDILASMARLRRVNVSFESAMPREQVDELFRSRSLVLLPSRYDQFNLVALEALRLGCPVMVSDRAGVALWIRENLPELSDLVIDVDCSRSASRRIRETLSDYQGARERVVDIILSHNIEPADDELHTLYEPLGPIDVSARSALADVQTHFDSFNIPRSRGSLGPRHIASRLLPAPVKGGVRTLRAGLREYHPARSLSRPAIKKRLEAFARQTGVLHEESVQAMASFSWAQSVRNTFSHMPERTSKEIAAKLKAVSDQLGSARVSRVPIFREMARLERRRGGLLVAATYCLRIMRWLGRDRYGDLDFVMSALRQNSLDREAQAAWAMYSDPALATDRSKVFLDEAYTTNLDKQMVAAEIIDDRRSPQGEPTVSVIVSLYNAESKLPTLLENLRLQTINQAGRLEVVLVDSASPTAERRVFEDFAERQALPMVYLRSANRETIQAAWNRGIKLAHGRYLSFLGADEGVHPECFDELARYLDQHHDIDWAMADSVVTNVDRDGVFAGDIMPYDRRGFSWQHVLLDSCYLAYVGGLYRKSIHDRFGYYDETFRGAGDTEFKNRILSRIKTAHVPKMLGVFNNYPEERTTQSPRAEIEDLRAWYLHRTPAGMSYSFDRHPVEAAQELFRDALCYRKSFCGHWSSDADLASSVATYMRDRGEDPQFAVAANDAATRLVADIESWDVVDFEGKVRHRQFDAAKLLYSLRKQELVDQGTFGLPERPHYRIFNDNRHEQHWWSWSA